MIVLPLGLGTRWPKMPVVTLAIAALLILVQLFDKSSDRNLLLVKKVVSSPQYRSAKEALYLEYCTHNTIKPETCSGVLPYIAPDYVAMERDERKSAPKTQAKKASPDAKEKKGKGTAQDKTKKFDIPSLVEQNAQLQLFKKFQKELDLPSKDFKNLKAFAGFAKIERVKDQKTLRAYKADHFLTQENINVTSVAMAQVRHAGWSHLIGNLVVFLALGIYVESRLGSARYLLAYIVTGSLGLAFNAYLFMPPGVPLVGASANISGVMGLFYIFFFQARMRMLLYFGWLKTIYVPVKYTLPIVFFVSDLTGALQSLSESGKSGVAHFAHLGGLISGMAIAWVLLKMRPLPAPFLYESEIVAFKQMNDNQQIDQKIYLAKEMLALNLDNNLVRSATLEAILSRPQILKSQTPNPAHMFLHEHLDSYCAINIRENRIGNAYRVVGALPLMLPFSHFLGSLGQTNNLLLADFAVAQKNLFLALRLYDAFILRWKGSAKESSLRLTVVSVLNALPDTSMVGEALQVYLETCPQTAIRRELTMKITMVQGQLDRMIEREDEYETNRAV
jgi:membrane associated rhomboid family serine protease